MLQGDTYNLSRCVLCKPFQIFFHLQGERLLIYSMKHFQHE